MFGSWRFAAAAALVLTLAGSPVQAVPLVDVGPSDVVVEYTWDPETGEVTDYSRVGGALPEISCTAGWDTVIDSATNTLEDRWQLQYRFDYGRDWFEVRDARGSTLAITTYECQGPSYDASRPSLLENEVASSGPRSCDGAQRIAVSADAPAKTGASTPLDEGETVDVPCLRAHGAGSVSAPGEAPFTGKVRVWAENSEGEPVAEATTCTMLGGSCWDGGDPGPTLDGDALEAQATSLRCEAENFLGLPAAHPAGTFGCEAFFE